MRRVVMTASLLLTVAVLAVASTAAQTGGFIPGMAGGGLPGGRAGAFDNASQVGTDSQGNIVLVRSGGSTTGYTSCATQ